MNHQQLSTVYATKRRRRNGKSLKPTPKDGVTKSNPSKRHRERLNAELDTLASLLPFEQNILSKLDRLSILRLSVSYLRTKSYFQVVMHKDKDDQQMALHRSSRDLTAFDHTPLDGEMFLQALNGFLMILTCDGEVFFATHSIEGYLGFHQSDIVHQSVYELVHSEDREELQRQLMWNSFLPPESSNLILQDLLTPDHAHLLERSFTVRFRCLLDNTSGFLRLDIRGRVKVLHGQNRKSEEPPLALFAICTPFGPPSLLEIPQKEVMFKSKHKLDLALVSMDQRGKLLLGYSDSELANLGGYDLVHYDDLAYVASAHQELLKTGASGMIAYRFQTKDGQWQWLQTSSRLVYKNSKPDFVISTHRPLMEEEGRDLLGKRTMDFKVSYLDAGLPNTYFAENDQLMASPTHTSVPATPTRVNRRYKTQLRDFLSTCRTKRKLSHSSSGGQVTPPSNSAVTTTVVPSMPTTVEYIAEGCTATYNMYPAPYAASTPDHMTSYMTHSATNFNHTLYPTATALDNRYLTTTDNIFHQYRPLSSYYPEYHHATPSTPYNGFLDMTARTYDPGTNPTYHQQVVETTPVKYPSYDGTRSYVVPNNKCIDVGWPYSVSPSSGIIQPVQVMSSTQIELAAPSPHKDILRKHSTSPQHSGGLIQPKIEEIKQDTPLQDSPTNHQHFSPTQGPQGDMPSRQTVLMWGSHNSTPVNNRSPTSDGTSQDYQHHHINSVHHQVTTVPVITNEQHCESIKGLSEINHHHHHHQWPPEPEEGATTKIETQTAVQNGENSPNHHVTHHNPHHNSGRVVMVL